MTDEQRKRIHDITYSTDDREELAERIVRLEDERDLYSSLVEDMDHPDTANQLRAENAKLRELTRGMYGMLATFDAILGNHDACETPKPLIFGEDKSFKDIMRELGIEVG